MAKPKLSCEGVEALRELARSWPHEQTRMLEDGENGPVFSRKPFCLATCHRCQLEKVLRELDVAERRDLTRGFTKADIAYFNKLDAASKRRSKP